jgi:molybdopterin synthase sulfur carrier subunit
VTELDILYFGSLREAIGRDVERVEPPSHVLTVADLIAWLAGRGGVYEGAFADPSRIRAALGCEYAGPQESVFGARDVALFPPPGVA